MTTYPTSTAPAAKAWLFGQMQDTLTADADWTFSCTYATEIDTETSPDDQVWMGDITSRQVTPLAMVGNLGAGSLQESYDLVVNISCARMTDQPEAAETRAFDLCGQVETIVRTDPTMGGNTYLARPNQSSCTVDWSAEDAEAANGRIATLTLSISCFAQI